MKLGTKLKGRLAAVVMAAMMGMTVMPATAFAQVKGDINADAATETTEETTEESTEEKIGDEKEEIYGKTDDDLDSTEPMDPLTPDGNLTLVDDLGEANGSGKQFITVVTKTGNYFYIIIDRDDEGEGTVHFLNQVDEADIFNLLDEDQQEEYIASIEASEQEEEPAVEEEPVEEEEEPVQEEDNSGRLKGILGIIGILALVAAGIGYYFVSQGKKKQVSTAPDPDADYMDEDDDDSEFIDLEEAEDADEYMDSDDEE